MQTKHVIQEAKLPDRVESAKLNGKPRKELGRKAAMRSIKAQQTPSMKRFPYMSQLVNDVFAEEKDKLDYVLLRPVILVFFYFFRLALFPFKLLLHRFPLGFEAYLIDRCMAFGIKYLARHDAAELMMRHVQVEPLLYRHVLKKPGIRESSEVRKLNGIDGDFSIETLDNVAKHNMTLGHDLLSYELADRFDKHEFLENLEWLRNLPVEEHEQYSKAALEQNKKYSFQVLGITNLVLMVVFTIMVVGDWRTTMTALNSFGSDSILLWCLKHLYADDPQAQITLDFFMQEVSHRGHYHCSLFFSNPNQYLYYHIVFDEVAYEMLRTHPPGDLA